MFVVDPQVETVVVSATSRLRAPFDALVEALGAPLAFAGPRGSVAWSLHVPSDPVRRLRLRDDRGAGDPAALEGFSRRPWYDWVVEADDERTMRRFCVWLSERVVRWVEARPPARVLEPDAKASLNALLASGVSLEDALRRAAKWAEVRPPRDCFAWPIHE